jgi:5-methylcytosine-specific restriction enzyme subunit McrC
MSTNPRSHRQPDRIQLDEHDQTDWLDLSDAALDALEEVNATDSGTRIRVEYGPDKAVRLHSSQYVGSIALPDGPDIRITPKAADTNFLPLLQYAHDVRATTYEDQTRAASGATFVDALAALFTAELNRILTRAPHHEYTHTESTETQLRGQLDLQRQLQRQGPSPTAFEVSYDELTSDTVANRGIYQATLRLTHLVEDEQLASQLQRQHQQLRTWVSTEPVTPAELARVEPSRLNEHYETILRLAEHVLRNSYLDSFIPTQQPSYGLLVNMNTIFENAIERAAQDALRESPGWTATPQSRIEPIATGGDPPVNMYPDVVIKRDDTVELVADAKWKTGTISQSDIYQMTSYMLAHDVPGILLFPQQGGELETSYRVDDRQNLLVREVATQRSIVESSFATAFIDDLRTTLSEVIDISIDSPTSPHQSSLH